MIRRRPIAAVGFLLPAVVVYALFVLYPLVRAALLSLTDSTGGPTASYVGLEQYRTLHSDPLVSAALKHTLEYAVIVVVVQNAIGLALAAALFRRPRVRRALSTLLLLPALVSPLMAAFIWSALYARDGGINALLGDVGLGSLRHAWLGSSSTALGSMAAVNVWMFAGCSCLVFLVGYAAIPREVLDAADVDGATGWRRFRRIEWPLLAPALTVNVTLSLIGALKVFELPLVLTDGGPAGSTQTLTLVVFQKLFGSGSAEFAYGTAVALLLLLVVVVLVGTVTSLVRLRERRA